MQRLTLGLRDWALWAGDNRLRAVALALLWALALISVVQGFHNAVLVSTDFQWSPVVLLSEGVNPYQVALFGNLDGKILLSQYPPYLHLLYIVMLPLAYLPYGLAKFTWATINLGMASACLVILARMFRLSMLQGALLAALFFLSTPYRNGVGNGQTSILCLLAFLLAWLFQNRSAPKAGASLSLLLTKYSFAPPILLWFLLRGRLKMLFVSLVLLIAGWLAFSWICHENPITNLVQPVKVANFYSEIEGGGDVMTLVRSFGLDRVLAPGLKLSALAALVTSILWVLALRWRAARLTDMGCMTALCLISLLSIRHLAYDFVFLAPAAALAFSLPRLSKGCFIVSLAYLGLGLKLLHGLDITGRWVELLSFVTLNLMLLIILCSRDRAVNSFAGSRREDEWPA
jgi:Glycosyltransferase family 87